MNTAAVYCLVMIVLIISRMIEEIAKEGRDKDV